MLVIKDKFFEEFSGHNSSFFELGLMVFKVHALVTFHKGALPFEEFSKYFDMNDMQYLLETGQISITGSDVFISSTDLIGV